MEKPSAELAVTDFQGGNHPYPIGQDPGWGFQDIYCFNLNTGLIAGKFPEVSSCQITPGTER